MRINIVMKEIRYIITDAEGIHARPAGLLVKVANQYNSKISISKEGKSVDAKKIFGVMGLGVKQGQEIMIAIDGDDELEATDDLSKFLKNNL